MRLIDSEVVPIASLPAAFSVDPVPAIAAVPGKNSAIRTDDRIAERMGWSATP